MASRLINLPAELRNRVHELVLSSAERLVIPGAAGEVVDGTILAVQPAITRVSRQLRAETLPMFYTTNTFLIRVARFDFAYLLEWVKCVTSGQAISLPLITISVKLTSPMCCAEGLLDIVRAWRDVQHENIHLGIGYGFEYWDAKMQVVVHIPHAVAQAVDMAERLQAEGKVTERQLRRAFGDWLDERTAWKCRCVCYDGTVGDGPKTSSCSMRAVAQKKRVIISR